MIGGKYVTIKSVIERVYRRFGFTTEVTFELAIELLFDLISFVGAPTAFVQKTTDGNQDLGHNNPIIIDNYRGTLPCDFHTCMACRTYPKAIPMTASTDLFHQSTYNLSDYEYQASTEYDLATMVEAEGTHTVYSYRLNNNYIFPDFKTGLVEMAYIAFPVDSDGYPMIPDDTRYITAAVYFIGENIAFGLWLQNKMSDKKYEKIERDRDWYIGSAGNSARNMNADERQSFINQVLRMIPQTNEYDYGNKYMGVKQHLRNFVSR